MRFKSLNPLLIIFLLYFPLAFDHLLDPILDEFTLLLLFHNFIYKPN